MEQKFKEFKEFYEKNDGKLAGVHKGHKALKMSYVEDMRIVVGKTDKGKDEIVTGFCYSPTESGGPEAPEKLTHYFLTKCPTFRDLNISTPAELSELITTLKKYLK